MSYTNRFTEVVNPLAVIHSVNATGALTSAYVSLRDYQRAVAILDVGVTTQTVDFSLLQAKTTTGTSTKAIAGKAITQVTDLEDSTLYAIELRTEELDVNAGFDCVAMVVTAGGASAQVSAILYGIEPNYAAVGTTNWNEVID